VIELVRPRVFLGIKPSLQFLTLLSVDVIVDVKPDIDRQPLKCLLIDLLCVPGASENDLFGAVIFTSRRIKLKLTFDHIYVLNELSGSLPNLNKIRQKKQTFPGDFYCYNS